MFFLCERGLFIGLLFFLISHCIKASKHDAAQFWKNPLSIKILCCDIIIMMLKTEPAIVCGLASYNALMKGHSNGKVVLWH